MHIDSQNAGADAKKRKGKSQHAGPDVYKDSQHDCPDVYKESQYVGPDV